MECTAPLPTKRQTLIQRKRYFHLDGTFVKVKSRKGGGKERLDGETKIGERWLNFKNNIEA